METQWYEVEISGKTYRTYDIKAESPKKAQEIALSEIDSDFEVDEEWKQGADIESCNPFHIDKDGVKIIGTSNMNNEEFGQYIRNNWEKQANKEGSVE
jgi:hypothetical protein